MTSKDELPMNKKLPRSAADAELEEAIEDHGSYTTVWEATLEARMQMEKVLRMLDADGRDLTDEVRRQAEDSWHATAMAEQETRRKLAAAKRRVDNCAARVASVRAALALARYRARHRVVVRLSPQRARRSHRVVRTASASKPASTADPDGEPPRAVTFTLAGALPEGGAL